MKPLLPALLLGLGLSTATIKPAAAYPVDCAILLCLAGGWPASAECAHARAVFIRRITPWPIEPPLQIWNCPMRASLNREIAPMERLFEIALWPEGGPRPQSQVESSRELHLAQDRADVVAKQIATRNIKSAKGIDAEGRGPIELAKTGCGNTPTPENKLCHAPNRRVMVVVTGARR